jgi:hypothetical protein
MIIVQLLDIDEHQANLTTDYSTCIFRKDLTNYSMYDVVIPYLYSVLKSDQCTKLNVKLMVLL